MMHQDTLAQILDTPNPFKLFQNWFDQAAALKTIDPNVMALATAGSQSTPSVRMVLLKNCDKQKFTFFTNLNSQKSQDIQSNPAVALCFYWGPINKQVRLEGTAWPLPSEVADRYFASRPRGSQIGAWASQQSKPLENLDLLQKNIHTYEKKFEGNIVPRPPHWSGFSVLPHRIEFWQDIPFRLHHRIVYTRKNENSWDRAWLYP